MNAVSQFMAPDHHRCDSLFAMAEESAAAGEWDKATESFGQFRAALGHHFSMEEQVLFPAFEERTGMTMGPTQVMRMEHEEMRHLLEEMADAARRQDRNGFLGFSDTLLTIMQQHNMKEEQMLYRMADQALGKDADAVIQRMKQVAK